MGLSVDSIYCHANWAQSLGGVSFPLLSDFHPKGEVARSYGMYLADKGITDRATVLIDAGGVVRYAASVTPAGQRDMAELASVCEEVAAGYPDQLAAQPPPGLEPDTYLFVKSNCGFSRAVLLARTNLRLGDDVLPVRNVSEDATALARLEELTGKQQAPCLVRGDQPMFESKEIIGYLVSRVTGL